MNLFLGDVIKIVSSKNEKINDKVFYVYYYDPNELMELININNLSKEVFVLNNNKIQDDSVEKIILINRSIYKGFARQNGLFTNKWIDIEIIDDIRRVFICQITNLEEDMIELTTYPDKTVLYIDFQYKGMPKNIPIKQICFCKAPMDSLNSIESNDENDVLEDVNTLYNDEGELEVELPGKIVYENDYRTELSKEYLKNAPKEMENIDDYEMEVVKYGIDAQINILLDDFLSRIPDEKRSEKVMNEVYIHLNRYKELRDEFSTKDEYGSITGFIRRDPRNYKPLVESLYNVKKCEWLIPMVSVSNNFYVDKTKDMGDDANTLSLLNTLQNDLELETKYKEKNNTTSTEDNHYENYYESLNDRFLKSFSKSNERIIEPIANEIELGDDMDMVISNNESDEATYLIANKTSEIPIKKKRSIKRFNKSLLYSKYLKRNVNEFRELMKGDSLDIRNLLLLPEKFIANSEKMYGSILEQTEYNTPRLSDILKKDPIEKQIDLYNENPILAKNNQVQKLVYNGENTIHDSNLSHPLYNAVLQSILPNIFSLIKHYYSKNSRKYNISSYLKTFSPYNISVKSLSFSSSKSIRGHIYRNVQNYKENFRAKKEEFNNYMFMKFSHAKEKRELYEEIQSKIFHNVVQKKILEKSYELTKNGIMSDILIDNGKLFYLLLLFENRELINPFNVVEPIVEQKHFYDASQKVVCKKYNSLKEMQDDNNKRDLKFDEKYDANNYDILRKYRKQRSQYTPEQFFSFLSEILAEEYGCSMDNTENLATELIQGFKYVQEGNYALLEIKPTLPDGIEDCNFSEKEKEEMRTEQNVRKIQKYFQRINNVWVYDETVDSSSFAKAKDLTCELNEDSVAIGNVPNSLKKIVENEYGAKAEEISLNIKKHIEQCTAQLYLLKNIKKRKMFEVDSHHIKLGNAAYISESMPSPNKEALDLILHKSMDMETKYNNLVWFCLFNCREPVIGENEFYLYCAISNIPLVPIALHKLATGFKNNIYIETFFDLVKDKLIKYEDGRYVIVHGGYILDSVDFSEQGTELMEEVEEKDTWDDDVTEVEKSYVVDISTSRKMYSDENLRLINNILRALCKNTFIEVDKIENTVMTLSINILSDPKIILKKKTYIGKMEKQFEKSSMYPSYESYKKSTLLDICVCFFIVSIQTLVPSFLPRRSFGNCIKILDGYPLNEDSGSDGTLRYISCILRKMQVDRKTLPWRDIPKGKNEMESRLKQMFDNINKIEEIKTMLFNKREYLKKNKKDVPENSNVNISWSNFLPPLQTTNILNAKIPLREIESSSQDAFRKTLNVGSTEQWKYQGMYFYKMYSFSVGFQELINQIVKEKGSLLGKYGKIQWLENTCCNELGTSQRPILYFKEEDKRILKYFNYVKELERQIGKIKLASKLSFAHAEMAEHKIKEFYIDQFCSYSEQIMYKTLISYSNLDSQTKPIPQFLESFITSKPAEYDIKASLEEKIAFLKNKNISLNIRSFEKLMLEVFNQNEIRITYPLRLSYQELILDNLNKLSEAIKNEDLSTFFKRYINREQIGDPEEDDNTVDISKETEDLLDSLENYFTERSDYMKKELTEFMSVLGLSDDSINDFFNMFKFNEKLDYTNLGLFIKNYLYYLSFLVPKYLSSLGSQQFNTKTFLMKHDIDTLNGAIDKKYSYLNRFIDDKIIKTVLDKSSNLLKLLYNFISIIRGLFPTDRSKIYHKFLTFCFFIIFHNFVVLSEDQEITGIIFRNIRKDNIEENEEHEENDLFSDDEDTDEIDISIAEKGEIQKRILEFMTVLLGKENMFHRDKSSLLILYDKIPSITERLEENEKNKMTKRFSDIKDNKARKSEKELKKYHIGKYYVNQKTINTYSKKRDAMLNTEDVEENDLIYFDEYDLIEDVLEEEKEELNNSYLGNDDLLNENEGEKNIFDDESDEDDLFLIDRLEDEDMYDIAENANERS